MVFNESDLTIYVILPKIGESPYITIRLGIRSLWRCRRRGKIMFKKTEGSKKKAQ